MTHDLMRDMLSEADIEVERIVISELVDQTFYATIRMTGNGEHDECRPGPATRSPSPCGSDSPIFGAEEVLEQAGIELKDDEEVEVEKFREFLDQVTPEDFATEG